MDKPYLLKQLNRFEDFTESFTYEMRNQIATKFQEQYWILNKIANNSPAYNIPVVFRMSTMLDIEKLEKAVNLLVKKYDVLLSEYSLENGRVMMRLADKNDFQYTIKRLRYQAEQVNGLLPSEILQEVQIPFDLSKAPLFRVKIFEYPDSYYISFIFHHIIIDLRSKEIFFQELEELYNQNLTEEGCQISLPVKQYKAYAKEHNEWLSGLEAKNMMQLWKNELPPINTLINLPLSNPRLKSINFEGKRRYFKIDEVTGRLIKRFASNLSINNFTFCLSAYLILLNKLTHQDKIIVGVPLSNRRDHSNADVFGCFVNIVPIQVNFENNIAVEEVIKQVRNKLLFAHRKQEIPFLSMIEQENKNRNLAYNPYFQSGFTFEPLGKLNFNGITMQPVPVEKEGAQLDLFVTMWEDSNGLDGYIEYSTQLFSNSMAKRIELTFKNVINEVLSNKENIGEVIALPYQDKLELQLWNNTNVDIDVNKCLHEQFEEQVLSTPNEIALRFHDKSLTYKQLNRQANKVANYLISRDVEVEDVVAISIDRSFELLISIIAIHKAGAAYLPLDARYPRERISTILEDGNPKIILTISENVGSLSGYNNVVLIDNIFSKSHPEDEMNPNVKVISKNLAYLLFTSGSTGRPKGVMVEHHSVINKLIWMQDMHPIDKNESLLLKTPITFDVSVWELFWWFFNGSSLTILPPDGEKDPKKIIETTANNNVSTLIFVPSMFAPFVEYVKSKDIVSSLNNLKYIILIGEALSPQLVMDFNQLRTDSFSPRLVNTYGPTEATVAVSYYNCPETNPVDRIFIGKPIYNTKLLIIDKYNHICPIGVPGELVISGENLARGYKNSLELNSEKFIEIKDLEGRSLKVYRTGDVARWDENGELDFIGRVDNQVKIRGYRIELGDIETKLLKHESVETTVIVVNPINEQHKQLVAYVVLKKNFVSDSTSIKRFLMENLPEYMVPAHIVILDKMPLNSSEKIDRKALPEPKLERSILTATPVSDMERTLCSLWENLLNIKNISFTSNFFDIGGNSLLVISMVAQIEKILDINIEPVTIMQFPSIRDLSVYLDDINTTKEQDDTYTNIQEKALLRKGNRIRNKIIK